MKKNIFIILLFLVSCVPDQNAIPPDVLRPDEMTRILVEIHLLEAKINRLHLPPDSTKVVYNHYEELLLKDLEINPQVYERSLSYYMENMRLFESVYQRVIDSLMVRESYTPPGPERESPKDSVSTTEAPSEE